MSTPSSKCFLLVVGDAFTPVKDFELHFNVMQGAIPIVALYIHIYIYILWLHMQSFTCVVVQTSKSELSNTTAKRKSWGIACVRRC